MSDQRKITDRQLALLCDLWALERAGLIEPGGEIPVEDEFRDGNPTVEVPGTLTAKGVKTVSDFHQSGRTIFP